MREKWGEGGPKRGEGRGDEKVLSLSFQEHLHPWLLLLPRERPGPTGAGRHAQLLPHFLLRSKARGKESGCPPHTPLLYFHGECPQERPRRLYHPQAAATQATHPVPRNWFQDLEPGLPPLRIAESVNITQHHSC